MDDSDAVAALKRLGLSNYEAKVFVALQELGRATAKAVNEQSSVPRSQVYGAAEALADRGLVEVIESSPKAYRPVGLEAARKQLRSRLEREQERAFEHLKTLRKSRPTRDDSNEAISTVRGRAPITERTTDLIETANHIIAMAAPADTALSESIVQALRDRGQKGVTVRVMTAEPSIADTFADDPIEVYVMDEDNPADFAGRGLMVDGSTVLLAVEPTDDGDSEQALWTAGTTLGHILAQFMKSGMQSGIEGQEPPN
jgi:sugar-specific transcriptional regulator TrmB